jgi:glycosyltransferase involved in cell wall biosynthesis
MALRACVVIPAYNAARTIGPLLHQVRSIGLDAVVVNDGSTDDTAEEASRAGALVMSHLENLGKGVALRMGFAFALRGGYDAIVTLDSDGQHDPREIPCLLETASRCQAAIVVGHRLVDGSRMPMARRWTNRLMSCIVSLLARQPMPDSQCGFRVIQRQALAHLEFSSCHFELETELLLAAARRRLRVIFVPIRTIYQHQASHIHPLVDGLRFMRLVLRYLLASLPGH